MGKAVNMLLAPVAAAVWGYENLIRDRLGPALAARLKAVPIERLVTPKANVAGPALEALRYAGEEDTLRGMYANLLATAMDKATEAKAHPAFVEILKQLTPDEARFVRAFLKRSKHPALTVRSETNDGDPDPLAGVLPGEGYDVLRHFVLIGYDEGCAYPDAAPAYLDNLSRLGLLRIPQNMSLTKAGLYDPLEQLRESGRWFPPSNPRADDLSLSGKWLI